MSENISIYKYPYIVVTPTQLSKTTELIYSKRFLTLTPMIQLIFCNDKIFLFELNGFTKQDHYVWGGRTVTIASLATKGKRYQHDFNEITD